MTEVSIVIPTYNRSDLLKETLQSVCATYPFSTEVIVIDDFSQDDTYKLYSSIPSFFKLNSTQTYHYYRAEKNQGMVKSWNKGLELAQGKWIKLLGDDDLLLPQGLEKQYRAAESNSHCVYCFSSYYEGCNLPSAKLRKNLKFESVKKINQKEILRKMIYFENIIGPPNAVFFKKIPSFRFSEKLRYAADWLAWIELLEFGDVVYQPEPVSLFRIHTENLTHRFVKSDLDFFEVHHLRKLSLTKLKALDALVPQDWFMYLSVVIYRVFRRVLRHLRLFQFGRIPTFLISFLSGCTKGSFSNLK